MKRSPHRGIDALFIGACVLCALPIMISEYPPMVDLPGHAAQIASVQGKMTGIWPFAPLFDLQWFTPYWLGYGVALLLAPGLGIIWSLKLVLAAAACALPWTAARFCTRLGIPTTWCWALLSLPFGFAFDWGFLNFIVAAPLGFLFLLKVLDYKDGKTSWASVVLWVHLLFLSHFLITAFFCMVAILLLGSPWRGICTWLKRCIPILSVLPFTTAWMVLHVSRAPTVRDPPIWDIGLHRLFDLVPAMVSAPALLPAFLIGIFFLCAPFLLNAKPSRSPLVWAPFVAYLIWMLIVPNYVGGNLFTYQRFALFGLPLYFIAFVPDPQTYRRQDTMVVASMALASLSLIGWHSVRTIAFNAEARDYTAVIEAAAPGKRILTLSFEPESKASRAPVFLHFPSWYQAEHNGLTDFNFSKFYVTPLRYRNEVDSRIELGFEWVPATLDWDVHRGGVYDYIIARSSADPTDWIVVKSRHNMELKSRSGMFWLYRRGSDPEL